MDTQQADDCCINIEAMATPPCLENPMVTVMGQKFEIPTFTLTFSLHALEEKWQPLSVLALKSQRAKPVARAH